MTEQENKAIELIGWLNLNGSYIITSKQSNEQDVHKAIDTIVNLVKKQANEIKYVRKKNKELVEQRSTLQWEYEELQDAFNHYKSISIRKDNVVEKDKVMKVIDYFEQGMQKECNGYIEVKYPFEVSYSEKVAKILRKKLLEEEQK